jgi:hypothetical protein
MRIVLDARKYFDFGIGTYIQNLIPHIGSRCELVILLAPDDAERITLPSSIRKVMNSSGKYSLGELRSIAKDANQLKADVFHSPHYTAPFGLKMPCVTTIHDILHVRGKEYFSFPKRVYARTMISHACRTSAAIIVDSEFTKQELLNTFHVKEYWRIPKYISSYQTDHPLHWQSQTSQKCRSSHSCVCTHETTIRYPISFFR